MFPTLAAGICFLLCCSVAVPRAEAWHTLMHPEIAVRAFEALPEAMKEPLREHLAVVSWASMVPDVVLQDWEHHVWNVHGDAGTRGRGVEKVVQLTHSLEALLAAEPVDWAAAAYEMGLLAHYLADLNQPLHTDAYAPEEAPIHGAHEVDAWVHGEELPLEPRGAVLRVDGFSSVLEDVVQANRYYRAVLAAYAEGRGFDDARGVTAINVQRAVEAVSDTWRTAWARAASPRPSVALKMNRSRLEPGDTMRLSVSALPGKVPVAAADVYLALYRDGGGLWFLGPEGALHGEPVPAAVSWPVAPVAETEWVSALVTPEVPLGEYAWIVVWVAPGGDPLDAGVWLGDPAVVFFTVAPLREVRLNELGNEVYLFPARGPEDAGISWLPLRRWDFLFFGGQGDDPRTAEDESATDRLIPGVYNHMLVYAGRDRTGTAYGMEMTVDLTFEGPFLRVVKLPEFQRPAPGSEAVRLPVVTKDIERYAARGALRPAPEHLAKLDFTGPRVLRQVENDIRNAFPYQLEFSWSGDLKDKRLFLVDDGRQGGAGCTDYWLATLETYGRVCIRGSRITAAELEDYFRSDPEGSLALVPDVLNPFPFDLTVGDVLDLGFNAVDPPPHRFLCDGSEEVGLPIPDRLLERSPDLVPIGPEPAPPGFE